MEIAYSILDPTGNITAIVESGVSPDRRPGVAREIMRRHPEVEQVGFLRTGGGIPALYMAGGEFCGNASMCAALLVARRETLTLPMTVRLAVSGAGEPVEVRLRREDADGCRAEITMPPAREITERAFAFEGRRGALPLVRMEGISHLIVGPDSLFFSLLPDRAAAERAVRGFCGELAAPCLGLLFLEGSGCERSLTPLVFVLGSGTVFWENACASGSAAVGMFLAEKSGAAVDLRLRQPGGILRVNCTPGLSAARLTGSVRLAARFSENFSESC